MDQIKKLSDTEIEEIIRKMDRMFLEEGYEKTYEWALRLIKSFLHVIVLSVILLASSITAACQISMLQFGYSFISLNAHS